MNFYCKHNEVLSCDIQCYMCELMDKQDVPVKYTDNTKQNFICVSSGYEPLKRKGINNLFNKFRKHGNIN